MDPFDTYIEVRYLGKMLTAIGIRVLNVTMQGLSRIRHSMYVVFRKTYHHCSLNFGTHSGRFSLRCPRKASQGLYQHPVEDSRGPGSSSTMTGQAFMLFASLYSLLTFCSLVLAEGQVGTERWGLLKGAGLLGPSDCGGALIHRQGLTSSACRL